MKHNLLLYIPKDSEKIEEFIQIYLDLGVVKKYSRVVEGIIGRRVLSDVFRLL